jgi:hypothetical protein
MEVISSDPSATSALICRHSYEEQVRIGSLSRQGTHKQRKIMKIGMRIPTILDAKRIYLLGMINADISREELCLKTLVRSII